VRLATAVLDFGVNPRHDADSWIHQGFFLLLLVVVVVEYLYSTSRSASNALIVPQRFEEMCL